MRTLAAGLLALAGCTLIVDRELSNHCVGACADAGPCDELAFVDGTSNGGQLIHAGVTAPSFRGPAFPPPQKTARNFGSTLAFVQDGGLQLVNGYESEPASSDPPPIFLRGETNFAATSVSPMPGHEGPGSFGCAELLAASYDALHDRTSFTVIPGGCYDDSNFADAGSVAGGAAAFAPALGWAIGADGGSVVAALFGTSAQACDETVPFTCIPPRGGNVPAGDGRALDSLSAADGSPVWLVTTAGAGVQLFRSDFSQPIGAPVVPWAGRTAALAADIGIAVRLVAGRLDAQVFDATAALRGAPASFSLSDASAHALEVSRILATARLRIAWLGGDGKARVATLDASAPAAITLSAPVEVCGSQGASFVAPLSSTVAAVQVGEALYLRRAP